MFDNVSYPCFVRKKAKFSISTNFKANEKASVLFSFEAPIDAFKKKKKKIYIYKNETKQRKTKKRENFYFRQELFFEYGRQS